MEDCIFFQDNQCRALRVAECEGSQCRFYQNKEQFYEGMKKAEDRLKSLGLQPVVINGVQTVEKLTTETQK